MIQIIVCIALTCDGCLRVFNTGEDYEPHFVTLEKAREQAAVYDWWTDGNTQDFCDECKVLKKHTPVPDKYNADCERCLIALDEHDD